MPIGIDHLIYSSLGLKLAAWLARAVPPRLARTVAGWGARWMSSRRDSPTVRAVSANQQVMSGGRSSLPAAQAVEAVFRHAARSVYDLYHYADDPAGLERMYRFDAAFESVLARPEFDRRGLVIAGLHMAGFDLGLRWICKYRFKPLVLTMPDPRQGRRLELQGRRAMGMNVLPFSMGALRQAVRHLQRGGMVLTGIDHPAPASDCRPCFFGRPATLPTEHIYMALRAGVPVVVVGSLLEADGLYHVYASPPIEMERHADRSEEACSNAERVLAEAEQLIRKAPQQWLIFQPVWPG